MEAMAGVARQTFQVSEMAENLIGSEIIKLAGEVNELIKKGEKIYNFTIGDFDPKIFPIPVELTDEIINAYKNGQTNYPAANGIAELREQVAAFLKQYQGLQYKPNEILIAGGARPIIYSIYKALVDPGDKVVFPVPSWNNNHYCHLSAAQQVLLEASPENFFMPTAAEIKPHLKGARLLALCSPLNPTGTTFKKSDLEAICDAVLEENASRSENEKPLYIMYDQIYWVLTYGETKHFDPVSLRPELRNYTIYVDGLSKAFAATGVRVGWSFGPEKIIDKMKTIVGHVGAWAPKAEQVASAKYLANTAAVDSYLSSFKNSVQTRLDGFYAGFTALKEKGYAVEAIAPQAAIYLTVKIDLKGKRTATGEVLDTNQKVGHYILNEAKLAIVPFSAFGASADSPWYRLSVGTCSLDDVQGSLSALESALSKLQ